jgi:hypothetical protein
MGSMNASTCAAIRTLPELSPKAACSPASRTIRVMAAVRAGGLSCGARLSRMRAKLDDWLKDQS